MQGILILALIIAIIIAVFSIQNALIVSLSFLSWEFEISLVVVILGSLVIGALMMGLFSIMKQFRLQKSIKKLKSEKEELFREKENIKNELQELKKNLKQKQEKELKKEQETQQKKYQLNEDNKENKDNNQIKNEKNRN